jgi:uncharacterized protein (TIGR00369 family)
VDERRGAFWDFLAGRVPAPPAAELLGWKLLEVDPERRRIRVEFQGRREFVNPLGTIQGGFQAAMLDDTMGPALAAVLGPGEFAPTLEIKVSFIRPARPGVLHGEGWVVHKGASICFLQGELRTAEGELVATATATARVVAQ